MPSLIYLTGFEQGYVGATGASPFQTVTPSSGTITAPAGSARNGSYGLRILSNSSNPYVLLGTSSATTNAVVMRVAVRVDALPTVAHGRIIEVGHAASGVYGCIQVTTGGVFQGLAQTTDAASAQNGPSVVLGKWHVVELRYTMGQDPWRLEWRVDGVQQTDSTHSGSAQAAAAQEFYVEGYPSSGTSAGALDVSFDNVAVSITSGDYPLGDGRVIGLVPDSDGTHSNATAGLSYTTNSFTGSNNVANGGTSYTTIDDRPWVTSDTDYLRQQTAATGEYAEYGLGPTNLPATTPVNAVLMRAWMRGATASSCNMRGSIVLSGTAVQVFDTAITTTSRFASPHNTTAACQSTKPGSGAWTAGDVDALLARIGYSGDANPDPWCSALMVEVDVKTYTYEKAGKAVASGVASGASAEESTGPTIYQPTGKAVASGAARGPDSVTRQEAGKAQGRADARGSDSATRQDTGKPQATLGVSAAKVQESVRTGRAAATANARAADSAEHVEAGRARARFRTEADDRIVTRQETGRIVATGQARAADSVERQRTGRAIVTAAAAGSAEAGRQGTTWEVAGRAEVATAARGADAHEAPRSGLGLVTAASGGTRQVERVEVGRAQLDASLAGTDVHEAVRTGSPHLAGIASGSRGAGAVRQRTGAGILGASAAAADAHVASRSGTPGVGGIALGTRAIERLRTGTADLTGLAAAADAHQAERAGTAEAAASARGGGTTSQGPAVYEKAGTLGLGVAAAATRGVERPRAGSASVTLTPSAAGAVGALYEKAGGVLLNGAASAGDVAEYVRQATVPLTLDTRGGDVVTVVRGVTVTLGGIVSGEKRLDTQGGGKAVAGLQLGGSAQLNIHHPWTYGGTTPDAWGYGGSAPWTYGGSAPWAYGGAAPDDWTYGGTAPDVYSYTAKENQE